MDTAVSAVKRLASLPTASVSMPTGRCSEWYSSTPSGRTTGVRFSIASRICEGLISS